MSLTMCGVSAVLECGLLVKRVTTSNVTSRAVWVHFANQGFKLPSLWADESFYQYTTNLALVILTLHPDMPDLLLLVYEQDSLAKPPVGFGSTAEEKKKVDCSM
jgi:hypothetical protein